MKSRYRLVRLFSILIFLNGILLQSTEAGEKPLVGMFSFSPKLCKNDDFQRGFRELGYVEGTNFNFLCEHAGGNYQDLDKSAAKLVAAKPDVIVVYGHAPTTSMQRATHDIPIVTLCSGDPVTSGFAKSLSRPGMNITGVTDFTFELNLKRLEFLKSAMPSLNHLAVLMHSGLPEDLAGIFMQDTNKAGKTLGFDVKLFKFSKLADLDGAYKEISRSGAHALLIAPMREIEAETNRIVELSRQHHLPTVTLRKSYPKAGILMSYGVDYASLRYRTAYFVDRILKGARAGELPIEQPTRFELVVNMNAAKELGLQLPESLLLRADKVIE